jgi:hypothetical protein
MSSVAQFIVLLGLQALRQLFVETDSGGVAQAMSVSNPKSR